MSNRDRLLQFLYDSKHKRAEYLADIKKTQDQFFMTRLDGEDLVYVGNGGTGAMLFSFTLKGVFKYKCTVTLDLSNRTHCTKFPGRGESVPGREDQSPKPTFNP